jgi:hypothetical protein
MRLWRLLGTEIDEKKDRNPETKDNQNPLEYISFDCK